jgi:hypothetical protein
MGREFRAAMVAAGGVALSLLFAIIAFRVITPAVLEAHFEGSTLAAAAVGLAMAAAIIVFTAYWVRLVGRLLGQSDNDGEAP